MLLGLDSIPALASSMTVEEAYEAIPHRQTTFDINYSLMSSKEAEYLNKLFKLVDLAIVERVQTLYWFQTDGKQGKDYMHYQRQFYNIISNLNSLEVPENLQVVHNLITQSIESQNKFFKDWNNTINSGEEFLFESDHPSIMKSHQELIEAYNALMTMYPNENTQIKQAFYDHLCVLDFK